MAQGITPVNEERLPSVTTILKATESEEKKASLQAWKQRVGQKAG